MYKISYLIIVCILLNACKVDGNIRVLDLTGNMITARGDVEEGFNTIEISTKGLLSPSSLEVIKGENYSLNISCDEALLPFLDYYISNNQLRVSFNINTDQFYLEEETNIVITVTTPDISSIKSYGRPINIDISSFDLFSDLYINKNYDTYIHMASNVTVTNTINISNTVTGLESITCGEFNLSEFNTPFAPELKTIISTGTIEIVNLENFPTLNSISGSYITVENDNYETVFLENITGEEITIVGNVDVGDIIAERTFLYGGSINIENLSSEAVRLSGVPTIDNLTATNAELTVTSGEATMTNIIAETIDIIYENDAILTLPEGTSIDTVTIDAGYDNLELESISANTLNLISNDSLIKIDILDVNNININSTNSEIYLPLTGEYESVDIYNRYGSIIMGGTTSLFHIKLYNSYTSAYLIDLSTLDSLDADITLNSYTSLILGNITNLSYDLSINTELTYNGTPQIITASHEETSSGVLNIIINGEELK